MFNSFRSGPSLVLLIALWPTLSLAEASNPLTHEHEVLEEIVVSATPLGREAAELPQSATVLHGEALRRQLANTIGETLARLPGLSDASFGQNVGRPVIRGQQGPRVGVLSNNMTVSDASTVSQDHAVSVEPFLADQIEVLRGPATLLYGSGSIGGVVNMVSHTIPQEIPDGGYSGRAMLQGNTAANEKFAAGRLDLGGSSFAFHADGFYRRTDDYEIPGPGELYPADPEETQEQGNNKLPNSFLDNEGGAFGAGWIGERWRLGASYTAYQSNYGIPNALEEVDGVEVPVTIDLDSKNLDAELVGAEPFGGFEELKLKYVNTNYEHTEFEGDEVGTVFNSDAGDVRLELTHNPWASWQGAFGFQYTDRDFSAVGEEAFVPTSNTKTGALFWVEGADFGRVRVDLGVRIDDVDIHVDELLSAPEESTELSSKRSFTPFSVSAGALWQFTPAAALTFTISNAERAPNVEELFAFGPHIATGTFEVGDPDLDTESNFHLEGGLRVQVGEFTGSLNIYSDNFHGYIYQSDTGLEEDDFPVLLWSQQGAHFTGGEIELRYDFGEYASGHWQVSGFGDIVKAKLNDGDYVPLIPPNRIGLGLDWDLHRWTANLAWIHASSHDDLAPNETPTPGYDLLNVELVYEISINDRASLELFLKGHNLLNNDIRNSTSFLKDQAPQIGRNLIFGLRGFF